MIPLTKNFFHLSILFRKRCLRIQGKHNFKSWNVMFFGTDEFSVINLKELFKCLETKKIEKLEVVTLTEKSAVARYAISKKLKLHLWPPPLCDHFDIGVVVSFGKLIPKKTIEFFPLGIINVHASLLPKYRGANPIFHAIKNGDSLTGITIIKIQPFKFDIGDIVLQETYELGSNDLLPYVSKGLANLGAKCLAETINGLPHSLEKAVAQSSDQATSAPKIDKTTSHIAWDKSTATEVYNLYRAVFGLYKLTTTWNSKQIKLICISTTSTVQSELFNRRSRLSPGTIEYCRKSGGLRVHCIDKPLYICTMQLAHKLLLASEFYKGYLCRVPKEKWIFQ